MHYTTTSMRRHQHSLSSLTIDGTDPFRKKSLSAQRTLTDHLQIFTPSASSFPTYLSSFSELASTTSTPLSTYLSHCFIVIVAGPLSLSVGAESSMQPMPGTSR